MEEGDTRWFADLEARLERRKTSPVRETAFGKLLKDPPKSRSRILPRLGRRELERRGEADLKLLFGMGDINASLRSKVIHRLFREIEWIEGGIPSVKAVENIISQFDGPKEALNEGVQIFFQALNTAPISTLFSRKEYEKKGEIALWRERPFVVREGEAIFSSSFDRVVLLRAAGKYVGGEVIRWGADGSTVTLEQLEPYRAALARITGLNSSAISIKVASVERGSVESL